MATPTTLAELAPFWRADDNEGVSLESVSKEIAAYKPGGTFAEDYAAFVQLLQVVAHPKVGAVAIAKPGDKAEGDEGEEKAENSRVGVGGAAARAARVGRRRGLRAGEQGPRDPQPLEQQDQRRRRARGPRGLLARGAGAARAARARATRARDAGEPVDGLDFKLAAAVREVNLTRNGIDDDVGVELARVSEDKVVL